MEQVIVASIIEEHYEDLDEFYQGYIDYGFEYNVCQVIGRTPKYTKVEYKTHYGDFIFYVDCDNKIVRSKPSYMFAKGKEVLPLSDIDKCKEYSEKIALVRKQKRKWRSWLNANEE